MFQLNKFQLKFSGAETKMPIFLHFADNKVVVTFIITRQANERTSERLNTGGRTRASCYDFSWLLHEIKKTTATHEIQFFILNLWDGIPPRIPRWMEWNGTEG